MPVLTWAGNGAAFKDGRQGETPQGNSNSDGADQQLGGSFFQGLGFVAANSDVAAIGPFDQGGSPLHNLISHRSPFGRIPEKADIHSDNP